MRGKEIYKNMRFDSYIEILKTIEKHQLRVGDLTRIFGYTPQTALSLLGELVKEGKTTIYFEVRCKADHKLLDTTTKREDVKSHYYCPWCETNVYKTELKITPLFVLLDD